MTDASSLVTRYAKGQSCDIDGCPFSIKNHVHINVPCACPESVPQTHKGCGFTVTTKQARHMPNGVLVGFINQAANAELWAKKNFSKLVSSDNGRRRETEGFKAGPVLQLFVNPLILH